MYQIRMDLTQGDQRPEFLAARGTKFLQKFGAITFDPGTRVMLRKSQIQRISAVSTGTSSGASAEAMEQPGNCLKWVGAKNGNGRFLAG
jgi:hypothetical protein